MTPEDLLASVAQHGLHPPTRPLTEEPLAPDTWRWFADRLSSTRLVALAQDATAQGALPLTEQQQADLSTRLGKAVERRAAADRCLDEVVTSLDREGIATCVLHGAATSALDYPQPGLRLYDSLHLLVAPAQRRRAVAVLVGRGVLRSVTATSWPRRFRIHSYVSTEDVEIVLHTSLATPDFGVSVPASELLANTVSFKPRAVALRTPGAEQRLLAGCIHMRLDHGRRYLLAQRDVVQLVLRDDVSVRKVERLASSWRVEAVLAAAVRLAWDTFRIPDIVPISAWSRSYQPFRRDRRRLAARPIPDFGT